MKDFVETNRIIAKFIGANMTFPYGEDKSAHFEIRDKRFGNNEIHHVDASLKFHKYWDWIMPVVKKIEEDFNATVIIYERFCEINGRRYTDPIEADRQKNVYYAVVNFLREHYVQ